MKSKRKKKFVKPFFFSKKLDRSLVGEWQDLPALKVGPRPPAMPSMGNIPYAGGAVIVTIKGVIWDWWIQRLNRLFLSDEHPLKQQLDFEAQIKRDIVGVWK